MAWVDFFIILCRTDTSVTTRSSVQTSHHVGVTLPRVPMDPTTTIATADILAERAAASERRLSTFRKEVSDAVPQLKECPELCIYTTGSFGRREAGRFSDLDLFFVLDDKGDPKAKIPHLTKTLIDADLIRHCKKLEYPPFSKDGVYLKVHTITDLSKKIGNQHEDSENIFTARMLLFLESTPLYNASVYHATIQACVREYCRDHSDHADNFRPLFLVNDIARFWKTLCLNYESARTGASEADKPKHKLKNLKLKYSRMMTCYSMLACLCDREEADNPEKLTRLVEMTPLQRLMHISVKHETSGLTELYSALATEYEWFLQETDREEADTLRWIVENKGAVSKRSPRFGDFMFQLLTKVAEATRGDLRYLVV